MLKLSLKILTKVKSQPNQGFTILEAIAAMLIALGFVLASLQAIVLATAFRVKVQEKQLATQLIQEEIDNIQSVANSLNQDSSDSTRYNPVLSRCTATQYSDGYAQALWTAYEGSTSYTAQPTEPIGGNTGNKRVGLRRLSEDLFPDDTPDNYNKDTDPPTSFPTSNAPYNSLKIWYEVRGRNAANTDFVGDTDDPNDREIIATEYIEITPNAALQCP